MRADHLIQIESEFKNQIPIARLRYLATKVHRLGPRPLFELLRELDSGADLLFVLERYARIDPLAGFITHFNGDRLPPPARLVRGRR
jgi:hypothetical protein